MSGAQSNSGGRGIRKVNLLCISHNRCPRRGGNCSVETPQGDRQRPVSTYGSFCFPRVPIGDAIKSLNVPIDLLILDPAINQASRYELDWTIMFRWSSAFKVIRHILQVSAVIETYKIDIVHVNSLKAALIGGVAARLRRRPVLMVCPSKHYGRSTATENRAYVTLFREALDFLHCRQFEIYAQDVLGGDEAEL